MSVGRHPLKSANSFMESGQIWPQNHVCVIYQTRYICSFVFIFICSMIWQNKDKYACQAINCAVCYPCLLCLTVCIALVLESLLRKYFYCRNWFRQCRRLYHVFIFSKPQQLCYSMRQKLPSESILWVQEHAEADPSFCDIMTTYI